MKKCPFCQNEIKDEAVKCRYCHHMIGMNGHSKPTLSPANLGIFTGLCSASYGLFLYLDDRVPPNGMVYESGGFWMILGAVLIVAMLMLRRFLP